MGDVFSVGLVIMSMLLPDALEGLNQNKLKLHESVATAGDRLCSLSVEHCCESEKWLQLKQVITAMLRWDAAIRPSFEQLHVYIDQGVPLPLASDSVSVSMQGDKWSGMEGLTVGAVTNFIVGFPCLLQVRAYASKCE